MGNDRITRGFGVHDFECPVGGIYTGAGNNQETWRWDHTRGYPTRSHHDVYDRLRAITY